MSKKLIFLFSLVLWILWFGIGNAKHLDDGSSASDIQKIKAIPIPPDRVVQPFHPFTTSEGRFCVIQYDNGSPQWYFPYFDTGWGFAVYMNPQDCEGENPYPFKITDVHFHLHDFAGAVWPVEIRVNIRDLDKDTLYDTLCFSPGAVLYHQTSTIPIDSCYDSLGRPMNLDLDSLTNPSFTCCLDTSFFLEIIFTGETDPPFPSLVMSDSVLDFPDTCHAWFLKDGVYYEWSEIWHHPFPGCPIMRMTGYTNSVDCDPCWYWKPDNASAPSGMPDFDQYQFDDSSALDVPTAVANCLWWFDAVPEDTNPSDLIRLLSTYFGTDPDSGTFVDSIQSGLDSCFNDYALSLDKSTYYQPHFREMADSLRSYQNIILLLGFWQLDGDSWHRFGGHAVTLTGVCSESLWVGVSDPAVDGAELGWQGRLFPLGHPPHPDDDTLHNNSIYVSHDIYVLDTLFIDYGDSLDTLWGIKDFYDADTSLFSQFEGRNFQPEQQQYYHPYVSAETVFTGVEYAIMICPKPTAVEEEEEVITPEDFQLFQNHPNPFNNETIINYTLSKSCHVSLIIYNILGQKVKTLVMEYQKAGVKTVSWDGRDEKGKDLSSGIYFYQLSAGSIGKVGEIAQTKRMLLLK
jgi:hypothetical protein